MRIIINFLSVWSSLVVTATAAATSSFPYGDGSPPFVVYKSASGVYKQFSNGYSFRMPATSDPLSSTSSAGSSQEASYWPSAASLTSWESVFETEFERNAVTIHEKYPSQEVSKIPWPSGDWPLVKDGINRQWDENQPSASAKYALANDLDVDSFVRAVSDNSGLYQAAWLDHGGPCETDSDCSTEPVLYLCGHTQEWTTGLCIPRWYGICDGWTSASLVEEEPKCPVKVNNVTFNVLDIKALISKVYAASEYDFLISGTICPADRKDQIDEYGRFVDPARRDIEPHVFHMLVANVMGRFRKSVILDIDAEVPLFNYALRSYTIQAATMMQPNDAASKFFNISSYGVFNMHAVQVQYIKMSVQYIHEGYQDGALVSNPKAIDAATEELVYEYVLELDADNEIIGSEWVNESKRKHPDVVWYAYSKVAPNSKSVGITYEFVSNLLEQSLQGNCS